MRDYLKEARFGELIRPFIVHAKIIHGNLGFASAYQLLPARSWPFSAICFCCCGGGGGGYPREAFDSLS